MNTLQQQTVPTAPVLKNVGVMGKGQLDDILSQFIAHKRVTFAIDRKPAIIHVKDKYGNVVLSAAKIDYALWHVRALEGLLVKVEG